MDNIFLTGAIQVGKSTLILKVLKDYPGKVCGFRTLPYVAGGQRLFRLTAVTPPALLLSPLGQTVPPPASPAPVPPSPQPPPAAPDEQNLICRPQADGSLVGIPEVFERGGVELLKACLSAHPDLILMDELGVFEQDALAFQETVWQCLDAPVPVLGVVKAKAAPFLDKIRARTDLTLLTVTKANREDCLPQLERMLAATLLQASSQSLQPARSGFVRKVIKKGRVFPWR